MKNIINNKFNWPIFCDEEINIGYLPIPKAANTSILNAIFSLKTADIQNERFQNIPNEIKKVSIDSPSRVHLYGKYMFDKMINKSHRENQYFIFSCVRHPVSRFISFYRDKILRWDPFIEEKLNSLGFSKNMGLDQCINNLVSIKDYTSLDQHIIPMAILLYDQGKLIPDYIMKVENLSNDWKHLNTITEQNMMLLSENSSEQQQVKKIILTNEQEKKLKAYYIDDMNLFHYV